ncbi:hypothetical protein Tco_0322923 [Tanacetum coccineum]
MIHKSWHVAPARGEYSNGPPSRFPSLLLAEKDKDGREFRGLFLLSDKSIRKIRLPEAYGKVCRSTCGWLITAGRDDAAQLINPLSRETINLPKVDTFDHPKSLELSEWHEGIRKLLIVTNNPSSLKLPLVVVLWGCFDEMGFCRLGDNNWTAVAEGRRICDLTYYNDRVYSFDRDYHIKACDVYGEDPTTLVDVSMLPSKLYAHDQHVGGAYIIGLDEGEKKRLLVVIRHGMLDGCFSQENYKTKRFLLFAYDLKDRGWSRVNDLGKRTLFVGHSSSFWIEDTTGVIKNNRIYFTDDVKFLYNASRNGGGGDMGIYHLSDGTIEPHFIGESRSLLTPPIWLQSV